MTKPFLVVTAAVAVAAAALRRKQGQADAELLWREATADASR